MFFCFVLVFIFCTGCAFAAPEKKESYLQQAEVSYREDFECAYKLQKALRENNKVAVVDLMNYPVMREKPLKSIESAGDFIENWNDFFDNEIISRMIAAQPEVVGWRGVMLGDGDVWFSNGKIDVLNTRTEAFADKFKKAQEEEFLTLHESVRGYKRIALECNTRHSHIRIQEHDDGLRYFSWEKALPLTEKPGVSLRGSVDVQGSAGNRIYTFKNGARIYEVDDSVMCEGVCKIHVIVSENDAVISDEVCE